MHQIEAWKRIIGDTLLLVVGGAVLGAFTGTLCLVLLSIPGFREWPSGYLTVPIFMGTFVGAPLGAVSAPILGWFVLRRVPARRVVVYTPVGTLVGSFVALVLGWLVADVADGRGIFYLVGGAVLGLVGTAFALRTRYAPLGGVTPAARVP